MTFKTKTLTTSMTLNVTYCSRDKMEKKGKNPAIRRYQSERIEKTYQLSQQKGEKFAILSGKYSLLKPGENIPYYDKLLTSEDVENLIPRVRKFLREEDISDVLYHTRKVEG